MVYTHIIVIGCISFYVLVLVLLDLTNPLTDMVLLYTVKVIIDLENVYDYFFVSQEKWHYFFLRRFLHLNTKTKLLIQSCWFILHRYIIF